MGTMIGSPSFSKNGRNWKRQINQKEQERNELTREFGTTNFNEGLINPYDVLLLNSREALASAQRHRIEAEAELDAVDSNKRKKRQCCTDCNGARIRRQGSWVDES